VRGKFAVGRPEDEATFPLAEDGADAAGATVLESNDTSKAVASLAKEVDFRMRIIDVLQDLLESVNRIAAMGNQSGEARPARSKLLGSWRLAEAVPMSNTA